MFCFVAVVDVVAVFVVVAAVLAVAVVVVVVVSFQWLLSFSCHHACCLVSLFSPRTF